MRIFISFNFLQNMGYLADAAIIWISNRDPPSRVHSQFCENVPEESCTLMEEGEHTSHYTTDAVPPSRTIVTTFDINHEINISACFESL
jgi:hypothetical protein